jgi:hypothetical protein
VINVVVHNMELDAELLVTHCEAPEATHARGEIWRPGVKTSTVLGPTGKGIDGSNPPFAVFQARELPLKVEVRKSKEAK